MIVFTIIIVILIIMMNALYQEMERRDALLLNATLSNASLFLANDFDDAWMSGFVNENLTLNLNDTSESSGPSEVRVMIQPDWEVVEGTYEHFKDENFETLLIAVGVPYFVRNMIIGTTPTVQIKHVEKGDDYYYDIEGDYIADEDQGDIPEPGYQLVITTSTWMKTSEERIRPGYSFLKTDFDGSPSKNTYKFMTPRVLLHRKEKENMNTDIIRKFDGQGFVMTIFSKEANMIAKRHFKRV
ncbi:uncharacterized protein LOC125043390 [Penaeus chinensis]|uniref:uncharacterized protein LOC125043390 n=1 Tax=Penaeus chinensis TaxID=139456 RepID=UPI001FB5F5F3|nr:uncharacterized protein LOC125043390 [Penaeus chinensis]XP_047495444.1 uncharacterized protein LOC125043390 [Penaeus chinensis]